MWKFFGRRKGEQLNVPPPANDNTLKVKKSGIIVPAKDMDVEQLMEFIRNALDRGAAVIIELSDDGS